MDLIFLQKALEYQVIEVRFEDFQELGLDIKINISEYLFPYYLIRGSRGLVKISLRLLVDLVLLGANASSSAPREWFVAQQGHRKEIFLTMFEKESFQHFMSNSFILRRI